MNEFFEEWDAYSLKQTLKQRNIDSAGILSNSRLKIITITGIRRCGKSSALILLRQLLQQESKKAAYVTLEDSRIKSDPEALDTILKWTGGNGFLFLDEITSAQDWEGWLARNHEMLKGKLNLIVSSSRKSLVRPNKPLRGRVLSYELFPLTFREFLAFNGTEIEKTTVGIGRIEKALNEYLVYGGFPEVVLVSNETDKIRILNSYFKDIIALDVAEISNENIDTVEQFAKYVIETPIFSASKCLNHFKSLGTKIGKQSLLNLEKNSQASYLFFFSTIFSYTIKDRNQYPRKTYLGDTGFSYSISGKKDFGKLFENAVFLELKRKLFPNHEIHYWKNAQGIETDFVVREGLKTKKIIQVVYELKNPATLKREIRGLVECAKELKLHEGTIITKDAEKTETINRIKIRFIPLWKWLLEQDTI